MTTTLQLTLSSKAADKTAKVITKATPGKTPDGLIVSSSSEYTFTEQGQTLTLSVYDTQSFEVVEVAQPT